MSLRLPVLVMVMMTWLNLCDDAFAHILHFRSGLKYPNVNPHITKLIKVIELWLSLLINDITTSDKLQSIRPFESHLIVTTHDISS